MLMPHGENYSWSASPTSPASFSEEENQLKADGLRRRDRTPFTHADAVKDDRFNEMIMLYLRDRSAKWPTPQFIPSDSIIRSHCTPSTDQRRIPPHLPTNAGNPLHIWFGFARNGKEFIRNSSEPVHQLQRSTHAIGTSQSGFTPDGFIREISDHRAPIKSQPIRLKSDSDSSPDPSTTSFPTFLSKFSPIHPSSPDEFSLSKTIVHSQKRNSAKRG